MKITVIIPAYNEEKLIFQCLQSIAQQTSLPDEIIVVDNASTDATPAIVADFIEDYPGLPVKLIHETIKGCVHAREIGWRTAAGDIIVHVDADEIFPIDWLAKIRTTLIENPEVHVIGGAIRFENAPPAVWITQVLYNLIYPRFTKMTEGFPYLCGGMTICRREVHEQMDGYRQKPDNQLEDYYFSLKAHQLGFKIIYAPDIYAIHSIRRYEATGLIGWLKWGFAAVDASLYDEDIR